jgi:small subunit ribosomal protein S13
MAYLLGTTIPSNKVITIALQQIYGIGKNKSKVICKNIGLTNNIRTFELKALHNLKLTQFVEHSSIRIKSDLVRLLSDAKKRLVTLRIYRGIRAKQGFPIRGQRTHTNAKTARKIFNNK